MECTGEAPSPARCERTSDTIKPAEGKRVLFSDAAQRPENLKATDKY